MITAELRQAIAEAQRREAQRAQAEEDRRRAEAEKYAQQRIDGCRDAIDRLLGGGWDALLNAEIITDGLWEIGTVQALVTVSDRYKIELRPSDGVASNWLHLTGWIDHDSRWIELSHSATHRALRMGNDQSLNLDRVLAALGELIDDEPDEATVVFILDEMEGY